MQVITVIVQFAQLQELPFQDFLVLCFLRTTLKIVIDMTWLSNVHCKEYRFCMGCEKIVTFWKRVCKSNLQRSLKIEDLRLTGFYYLVVKCLQHRL